MSNTENFGQKISAFLQTLWQKAVGLYRQLFWSSSQWLQYAEKLSEQGDIPGAFEFCDRALKKDSQNYSAWCKKGYLFQQQHQYEEALSNFSQALQIKPDLYQISHEKGKILNQLQRYQEAVSSYDNALKFKQDLDTLWIEKADILMILKQIKEAFNSYQEAQKLNPTNPQLQPKLDVVVRQLQQSADQFCLEGNRLFEKGNFKEALVSFNQAIAHREDFVDAWYQKGKCLAELNLDQEAIAAYDQTLALQPNSHLPWIGKGDISAKDQRFQQALDCYDKALSLNPNNTETTTKINAMVGELEKLEAEGEGLLQQAIDLTDSQQYQEAMKIYDQALELIGKSLVLTS